jgi:transposase
MIELKTLTKIFNNAWLHLDERSRRIMAASIAVELGYGGVTAVSKACGLSRVTITNGIKELNAPPLEEGRIHRPGAGRPSIESLDTTLEIDLNDLVEDTAYGDPEIPKLWTIKSCRTLADDLQRLGHQVSHTKVMQLLKKMGYSLQANYKTEEGDDHIDRDAQFNYINKLIKITIRKGFPVISVDPRKKNY